MAKKSSLQEKLNAYYQAKDNKNASGLPNDRGELHYVETDALKRIVVDKTEFEDVVIITLTDLHIGSSEAEYERAQRYLEMAKQTPNAVIIVNGDMINNAIIGSKSDTLTQSLNIVPSTKKVFDLFNDENIKSKIIVNARGNHEERTAKLAGIDASMMFGIEEEKHAKGIYLIEIKLKNIKENAKEPASYWILGSHGKMAKGRAGTSIDALLTFASTYSVKADLIVAGHVHQNTMGRGIYFARNGERNNKIEKRKITAAVVPPGIPLELYALEKNYTPSNTDLQAFSTNQWLDKGVTSFHTNTVSLDRVTASQNLLTEEDVKRAERFQAELRRAETRFINSFVDKDGNMDAKQYERYLLQLAKKAADLGKEFGEENEFTPARKR